MKARSTLTIVLCSGALAWFGLGLVHEASGATIVNGVLTESGTPVRPPLTGQPPRANLSQLIDFDDAPRPCFFIESDPLRNEYQALGVVFTGPGALDGGAVLDQCGNFVVSGYSPPNFVGFNATPEVLMRNGGRPIGPEYLDFSLPILMLRVGIAGCCGGTALLNVYDASRQLLGSASIGLAPEMQFLAISAPGIRSADLSVTGTLYWVFDDLSFETMPTATSANSWGRLKQIYR